MFEDRLVFRGPEADFTDVQRVVAVETQKPGNFWREGVVDEELHALGDGELAFHGRRCGEAEAFADVFGLEVRVVGEDLRFAHSASEHAENGRDGDAEAADAGDSAHLVGVDGDAVEVRGLHVGHLPYSRTINSAGNRADC